MLNDGGVLNACIHECMMKAIERMNGIGSFEQNVKISFKFYGFGGIFYDEIRYLKFLLRLAWV